MNLPSPITHQLAGAIVAYDVDALLKGVLVVGPDYDRIVARLAESAAQLVAHGELMLRLSVALFDRPFLFAPHSISDEAGRSFRGEVIFDWLRLSGYDMPRSEVFGLDARGRENQVFARDIDIEAGPIVSGGPIESPVYVACLIGQATLPPRFASALKLLATIEPDEVRAAVAMA